MHGPKIRRNNSYGGVQSNIRTRRGQYRYSDGRPYTGNRIHMHNGRAMEGAYHSPVPHEYLYKNNGGGMSYMTEEPDYVDPCGDGCFQNLEGGCDCYAVVQSSGGGMGNQVYVTPSTHNYGPIEEYDWDRMTRGGGRPPIGRKRRHRRRRKLRKGRRDWK